MIGFVVVGFTGFRLPFLCGPKFILTFYIFLSLSLGSCLCKTSTRINEKLTFFEIFGKGGLTWTRTLKMRSEKLNEI